MATPNRAHIVLPIVDTPHGHNCNCHIHAADRASAYVAQAVAIVRDRRK